MTKDDLKGLFGHFQNLNLVFLIEDLRRGFVAVVGWRTLTTSLEWVLCPVAHGWKDHAINGAPCSIPVFRSAGFSQRLGRMFTEWWDGVFRDGSNFLDRRDLLIAALEEILAERQADADAIQAVINAPQHTEAVLV